MEATSPERILTSRGLTAAARTAIRTCPGPGRGRRTVRAISTDGGPYPSITAACICSPADRELNGAVATIWNSPRWLRIGGLAPGGSGPAAAFRAERGKASSNLAMPAA